MNCEKMTRISFKIISVLLIVSKNSIENTRIYKTKYL